MPESVFGVPLALPSNGSLIGAASPAIRTDAVLGLPTKVTAYDRTLLNTRGILNYWPLTESVAPWRDIVSGYHMTSANGLPSPGGASLIDSAPGEQRFDMTVGGPILNASPVYVFPPQLTIMCWLVLTANASNNGIMGAWTGAGGSMLAFTATNVVRFYTSTTFLTGPTLTLGTRYFLSGSFDGVYRRMYVDGKLFSGPTAGVAPETVAPVGFQINGYGGNSFNVQGYFQKPAVFSRALSEQEHWQIYQAAQF